ncbi:SMEK domain-containing protein [Ensifer sesbaniae]|uniref:SMEK domain-containing protein n=1 Tax=Ensifer sesbaniae TaxID=1214071 RepID=UPI0020012825|nr:SMEK domain-containing protein [Ensifer sesbaniae]
MIRKSQLITQAHYFLSIIRALIKTNKTVYLTDINKRAEDFYREVLNIVERLELVNINIEEPNAAAIDLGDKTARIAIQVTSTKEISKIKSTFDKFIAKGLNASYDQLIVLNINEAGDHRTESLDDPSGFKFQFDRDLWDMDTIVERLEGCEIDATEKLVDYLKDHVRPAAGSVLPNEELTILTLIETLGEESEAGGDAEFRDEPDPEGKIEKRFAEHADFLKTEYKDLREVYGSLLDDTLREVTPTRAQIRKMQIFMKRTSDRTLTEENGNPEKALNRLTARYGALLSDRGVSYDESAVRFFLLDQVIKCNVFPNRDVARV